MFYILFCFISANLQHPKSHEVTWHVGFVAVDVEIKPVYACRLTLLCLSQVCPICIRSRPAVSTSCESTSETRERQLLLNTTSSPCPNLELATKSTWEDTVVQQVKFTSAACSNKRTLYQPKDCTSSFYLCGTQAQEM